MWSCHVLLAAPLLIAALFLLLPWPLALPGALLVSGFTVAVAYAGARALRRPAETGVGNLIGAVAEAVTDLGPEGMVRVHGELWRGKSTRVVAQGRHVRIVGVDGLTVRVEPIEA
jgi:membrane-bound serine protease (ClpP class)